jgi:hypothetical protein
MVMMTASNYDDDHILSTIDPQNFKFSELCVPSRSTFCE